MESGARLPLLSPLRPRAKRLLCWRTTLGLAAWLTLGGGAVAKTFETRDAALRRVFGPEARLERRTDFLAAAALDSARALAGAPIPTAHVSYHEAWQGDSLLGRAYLDTHVVRNEHETLLIVLDPEGRTRQVDILAFDEPEDYLPPRRWLAALQQRTLSKHLRPGDGVDAISGATLSARAATAAVRRVLALDRILHGGQGGKG